MSPDVTIVVVPRDRFSTVGACARSIAENTCGPIRLVFLDFGYTKSQLTEIASACEGTDFRIETCGRQIPLQAFAKFSKSIDTRYVVWIDNDTFVTPGWLTELLRVAKLGAKAIMPLVLEREGLDVDTRRLELRNHISHSELRGVTVGDECFVFDHKPFRRAAVDELPTDEHTIDFFELHAFFIETETLRQLDLPEMVVREHIDLGIQLNRLGIPIWCAPQSHVYFDNLHERPDWTDLRFFFFRWAQSRVERSHRLFQERNGYRFYNERFMKNWATRRKVFSVARWLRLPNAAADFMSRAFVKLLRTPIPAELRPDPLARSQRMLPELQASLKRTAEPASIDA
jgi:GT2 family glycosyltransferase